MAKGSGGWPSRGSGGGGSSPRKMQDMQAKLMEGLTKAQEDLTNATVEGSSGGGTVKVVLRGDQRVASVSLAPEVVDPEDIDMLQDLLVAAFNDASEKVQDLQRQMMGSLTGGLTLPGLT
jgi:nucleoid-associated protein EbfC